LCEETSGVPSTILNFFKFLKFVQVSSPFILVPLPFLFCINPVVKWREDVLQNMKRNFKILMIALILIAGIVAVSAEDAAAAPIVDNLKIYSALLYAGVVAVIFGVMKYGQKKYGPNPEAWNPMDVLQLVIVAAIVTVWTYFGKGVIAEPDLDMLMGVLQPLFAILGTSVFALTGYKLTINYKKSAEAAGAVTPATVEPATGDEITAFGFTVKPAFLEGKSPYVALAKITCSQTVAAVTVDWKDGSPVVPYTLQPEDEYMVIGIAHQYTFVQDGKYTGMTFYPEIQVIGKNGKTQVFNTAETGRCLSIYVQA
jgi:hypothetical protein